MDKQKRILMLGGSYFQVPAIRYAKEVGYYVITCGNLPNNPGHKYSDEYYNISTTDKEAILKIARRLKIDGILAYASDPAAATAAYVSDKLGLPGNSYQAVKTLSEKDLFRDFLRKNHFNVPLSKSYTHTQDLIPDIKKFNFPLMVKPVDSSGSKGVSMLSSLENLDEVFDYALSFSRCKRVIVEEYICGYGAQMHGDAFVIDGKLFFCYLGDHHYNLSINPFVPYSTTLPSLHSVESLLSIENDIQRLIDLIGIKQGAFNIEARVDQRSRVFLMEVGPRNGGNLVPQLEQYASGFDMVAASVNITLGNSFLCEGICKQGNYAYYVLHSKDDGVLKDIHIAHSLDSNILERHIFKIRGDSVYAFNGSNATLGILLMQFPSMEEMQDTISNMDEYVNVELL